MVRPHDVFQKTRIVQNDRTINNSYKLKNIRLCARREICKEIKGGL